MIFGCDCRKASAGLLFKGREKGDWREALGLERSVLYSGRSERGPVTVVRDR